MSLSGEKRELLSQGPIIEIAPNTPIVLDWAPQGHRRKTRVVIPSEEAQRLLHDFLVQERIARGAGYDFRPKRV